MNIISISALLQASCTVNKVPVTRWECAKGQHARVHLAPVGDTEVVGVLGYVT